MATEVRSQRLMQFLQVTSNPALAPFAKFQYVIREIAKSLDLDPDKVTNNMNEAALQAELMKEFQTPMEQQPPQQPMGGTGVQDPTGGGGGNIGVGQAPIPGEQGFSGNVGQQQQGVEQTQTNVEQSPAVGSVQ